MILCGICDEPITKGRRGTRGGITVDHIIPLSVGGRDTIRNMQPAHSLCNVVKGDRVSYRRKDIVRTVEHIIRKKQKDIDFKRTKENV